MKYIILGYSIVHVMCILYVISVYYDMPWCKYEIITLRHVIHAYTYIYTYVYTHVYVYVYVYAYTHIYIYIYNTTHTHIYIYIYIYTSGRARPLQSLTPSARAPPRRLGALIRHNNFMMNTCIRTYE